MKTDVLMPRLSDAMEEGLITRWLVADGDVVRLGQEIVEIETDKATVEFEADSEGVLRVVVAEGQSAAVGTPIATIDPQDAAPPAPQPAAEPLPVSSGVSPLARRLARSLGVDLEQVAGSGPFGRVLRADVAAAASTAPSPAPAPRPAPAPVGDRAAARLARLVAERMERAKREIPEFTVTADLELDAVVAHREQLRKLGTSPLPSLNDYVVRAAALALRANPRMVCAWEDGRLVEGSGIHIGIAVAAGDTLLVPVVRAAEAKPLMDIARECAELSRRARARTLTPDELSGGTFTVSNLGMFGVSSFTAIINAPQSAILAVGGVRREPVIVGDRVEPGSRMSVTVTCDHRVIYGAHAAQFLASLRETLALPAGL